MRPDGRRRGACRGEDPSFSMPSTHPGARRNGGLLSIFINMGFIENAIERASHLDFSSNHMHLRPRETNPLACRSICRYAQRNHSRRSRCRNGFSAFIRWPCVPAASPSRSDFLIGSAKSLAWCLQSQPENLRGNSRLDHRGRANQASG